MAKDKPIGVTMDWLGNPTLLFSDGCTYLKEVELALYKEYYPNGQQWPVDPETGERLPIINPEEIELNKNTGGVLVTWTTAGIIGLMLILFFALESLDI